MPSSRRTRRGHTKLNLTPVLDAVFIFIFFLLMSANFLQIFEISSDVPTTSDAEPPKNLKPLGLTLKISESSIEIYTGIPSQKIRSFGKDEKGKFKTEDLHNFLLGLKRNFPKEKTAIFEPTPFIKYEEIVEIMDAVRQIRNTDDPIYEKDKDNINQKLNKLFDNIVFGNLLS